MPDNLVIVHLESVSREIVRRFPECFPSLDRLAEGAVVFDRHIATATSSLMSFCDAMHGNSSELDHVVSWSTPGIQPRRRQRNLLDVLRGAGYRVRGFGHPAAASDDIRGWGLFGEGESLEWTDDHDQFVDAVRGHLGEEQPFAAYVWDIRSHLSYSGEGCEEEMLGFDRVAAGHRASDDTLGLVLDTLDERGLSDSTVVVAFGDHGDQFWTHGLYFGFCHGFEPYSELVHTPLAIRAPGLAPAVRDDLVSTVDLKPTITSLLGLSSDEARAWDAGMDVMSGTRPLAYSQCLFPLQEPNKALTKSYSVTDHRYHLMVSHRGLEMYAYELDPGNGNNLLSYFELGQGGRLRFREGLATHSHFRATMNPPQVRDIQERFSELRGSLARYVANKYAELPERRYVFDVTAFDRVRPREQTWNADNRPIDDHSEERLRALEAFCSEHAE